MSHRLMMMTLLTLMTLGHLVAGHSPPPPPPPPPKDFSKQRNPDKLFTPGSPKYKVLVEHKSQFELLAPMDKYVVGNDEADPYRKKDPSEPDTGKLTGLIVPWHILKENQKWDDWMLPLTPQKWSDESAALVQDFFKNPDDAKLEGFKKLGESLIRVIEQEEAPDTVREADVLRLRMMAPFPGVHRQAILIDLLTSANDTLRFKALEMLKEEKEAPVWPLLQMYLSRPDKADVDVKNDDPRNPQVRAFLESRLGAEALAKIENDLKVLRQVNGANLVIRIKDEGLHPWSKALRLDSLADLNSDEIREKGIPAFVKAKKMLEDTVSSAQGDDPLLALFRDIANLEAGNPLNGKLFEHRLSQADWGLRQLVAQKLVKTHFRSLHEVTGLLLNLQRDKVRSVRLAANETLSTLYLIGPRFTLLPHVAMDSIVIQTWEAWREQRKGILPPDESPVEVPMREANRNTYTSFGPASHRVLEGTLGKLKLTVVDHNANGRYSDLGIDNFHAGDTDKPGQFLSRLVEIEGTWYHLDIDEIYKKLLLKPYKGPLGKVTIETKYAGDYSMPFVILAMGSDATVTLFNEGGGFKGHSVPAGEYNLYSSVVWIDKSMATRAYQVHLGPGKRHSFPVAEGKGSTITFGGDLEMMLDAALYVKTEDAGKASPVLRLKNPVAYGNAGENYHDYSPAMASEASGKIIEVRAFKALIDKKAAKTWKWQMVSDAKDINSVDIYNYIFQPLIEKFEPLDAAWLQLEFMPPFATGCKPTPIKVPLEKVEERRWNELEGLDASGKPKPSN